LSEDEAEAEARAAVDEADTDPLAELLLTTAKGLPVKEAVTEETAEAEEEVADEVADEVEEEVEVDEDEDAMSEEDATVLEEGSTQVEDEEGATQIEVEEEGATHCEVDVVVGATQVEVGGV
jgi:hypothetical protein